MPTANRRHRNRTPHRWALSAACLLLVSCAHDAAAPEAPSTQVRRGVALDRVGDDSSPTYGAIITFEDFAFGTIHGQHDWQAIGAIGSGAPPRAACAEYDHEIADVRALLAPAIPFEAFGERSLRVSNAVTSGCYSDQTFSSRTADVGGELGATSLSRDGQVNYALPGAVLRNHFDATWLVTSAKLATWQPGLEMVVAPGRGDDHRMSWLQIADWADGLAVVFAERSDPAAPGAFQRTTVVRGLDRAVPHRLRLALDFFDGPGNDVARVWVDGVLRHTGASWETYYRYDANGKSAFGGNTPAVNRLMFRTGSDAHRGVPGDPAPLTRGYGFLIDAIRLQAFSVPRSRDDCKALGWRDVRDADGEAFRNQGECVSSLRGKRGDP